MLVGTVLMLYDKWAARRKPRARVPEAALVWLAMCGGAPAMWVTMYLVRHKTRKAKFVVLFPLLTAAWAAVFWYFLQKEGWIG